VATLKGIVPADERTVTDVISKLREGDASALSDPGEGPAPVLLGAVLARGLHVGVGDVVTVTSPRGRLSPVGLLPRVARVRVVGLVKTGLFEFDAGWGYMPLASAQRLFGEEASTLVEVRLDDMFAVRPMAKTIVSTLGDGFVTTDWVEMNGNLFSALWIEKVAIGITIGLIVAVAALNIVATLVLMVMEKHKDIAILASMGASRGAIMRLFMLQGTIIGAVGTAVGGRSAGACSAGSRPLPPRARARERLPDRLGPLPAAARRGARGARERPRHLLPGHPLPGPRRRPTRPRRGPPVRVTVATLLQARGLSKSYRTPAGEVPVLQGLDLDVPEGEMLG
jgi:ABC-type lipoprotein release transport system permease subunit